MKHHEIADLPAYYEVALARSGAGGRRIGATEVVRVLAVERDPFYQDSVRYRVRCERGLTQGLTPLDVTPRDVLRRVVEPDQVERWDRSFALADKYGWVHKRDNEGSADGGGA